MKRIFTIASFVMIFTIACHDRDYRGPKEDYGSFAELGEIFLSGGETAAEISTYDPITKKLFVTNATKPAIEVIDMTDPNNLVVLESLPITAFGEGVNSVAVRHGKLAAAVESSPRTDPGKVVIWETRNLHAEPTIVTVGALPDMVIFSPNGRFILSANEGEPSEDNTIDPNGTVSIIDVARGYQVITLDFTSFTGQLSQLKEKGYRVFNSPDLAKDTEPEYITVSEDSKTAWVTLQENNAIARINLLTKRIDSVFPLGFKDYSLAGNEIDPSDKDDAIQFVSIPVKGMYLPDAIASFGVGFQQYLITANEGDSRLRPTSDDALPPYEEGDIFNEEARIKDVVLDPTAFPNAADLRKDKAIGRLKITNTLGDTDGDGDFDELYSFGARSFSIWNGYTGELVFDSGNKLEKFLLQEMPSLYDDGRSDDKGVEPESATVAQMGRYTVAFIGLERADAVVVVNVTNPRAPEFLQVIKTGDAPEGLLFIPAHESPNGKSLLVVSSEGDGRVKVYQPSL